MIKKTLITGVALLSSVVLSTTGVQASTFQSQTTVSDKTIIQPDVLQKQKSTTLKYALGESIKTSISYSDNQGWKGTLYLTGNPWRNGDYWYAEYTGTVYKYDE